MASRILRLLMGVLLIGLAGMASAATTAIDLFSVAGVPGTGGSTTIMGPCYCTQPVYFSPVIELAPGTYDFGTLRDYWVQSGSTPDGGPDQSNLYLLFAPVETSGTYPYDFPDPISYANPAAYDLCSQDDAACNAAYQSAWVDFDLVYTVPEGQNAIQIALIGNYVYIPPVPEPGAWALLALGVALLAAMAGRRNGTGLAQRA